MNPFGIGFKEQSFLFKSFTEALEFVDKVDDLDYKEFNPLTHEKFVDSIFKKGRVDKILKNIVTDLLDAKN